MQWQGTYSDPAYGGNVDICVSTVGTENWGQAVFSEIGYMRGIIDASNLWTGDFWTAGYEVKQGTFSLQFSAGGSTTLTGTFYEKPGITYTFASTQLSSSIPTDVACFKSDDQYLSPTNPPTYNYNGSWVSSSFQYNYMDPSTQQLTASFGSGPLNDVFTSTFGVIDHKPAFLNGQISAGNFYESGNSGIELYVPKNATAYYITWWYLPRVADFNYTADIVKTSFHQQSVCIQQSSVPNWNAAAQGSCYMLPTTAQEDMCFGSSTTATDSTTTLSRDQITGICIGVFGAMLIGAMIGYFMGKRAASATPLAHKDATKRSDVEMH